MEISLTKLLLIALVILIVFGGGKLPGAMKDLGKGIRNFRQGLKEGDDESKKALENKNEKDKV